MILQYIESEPGAELLSVLPVIKKRPYNFYTLFSVKVPDLMPNDFIDVRCQFEVTNDLGYNALLGHTLLFQKKQQLATGETKLPDGETIFPCFPAGENVTPAKHHGFRSLVGAKVVKHGGDAWVTLVVYAGSDAANQDATLKVEKGYGGLSITVHRS